MQVLPFIVLFHIIVHSTANEQKKLNEIEHRKSSIIHFLSFEGPFQNHDPQGQRYIPLWNIAGDTTLLQSFLRLTPDRPFTKGSIWSQQPLSVSSFSLELKFRISGKNLEKSGDFVALWFTKPSTNSFGEFFGVSDTSIGIGIILNTKLKGDERKYNEINVVIKDGQNESTPISQDDSRCIAYLRYWEGRDDFNVLKSSRIRVKFSDGKLLVEVDSRNIGRWRKCVSISDLSPFSEWMSEAKIGIHAENGSGSNNNDIIRIRVYDDPDAAWELQRYDEDNDDDGDEWSLLVHHMEHEMFTVQSSLKYAIEMLETAESAAETRIRELELRLSDGMMSALEQRLYSLESQVHRALSRSIQSKLSETEKEMSNRMESKFQGNIQKLANSWQYPFYILAGAIGAMCILLYFKYWELKKEHLL